VKSTFGVPDYIGRWDPPPIANELVAVLSFVMLLMSLLYVLYTIQRDGLTAWRKSMAFYLVLEFIISAYLAARAWS